MGVAGRLRKLRAMSPGELATRLAYSGRLAVGRLQQRRQGPRDPRRLRRRLDPSLARAADWEDRLAARTAHRRFFAGLDDPDRVRATFAESYPDNLAAARAEADRVARHEIAFFGERFDFGPQIPWHRDPVSGAEWPRLFHADVPVHGGDRGFGDVKYVWELNRHQFLIDLARVAFLDGSEAHRDAVLGLVADWQAGVPYATGAPWACALEPAFRAWSWMWAYELLLASTGVPRPAHLSWLAGFEEHGRFLYRHLETYSSPYNHLIGEAAALCALGLQFPEFAEASRWMARGRSVLESTVRGQFHSDGGTVEQSTFYHHATLGFYLLAALLGRRHGVELSDEVWRAVERGIAFSMTLTQPDGRVPAIGGADDGKPIRLEHLPFWDFRPYQAVGAVLFDRADFRWAAGEFSEDALWLLGPEGRDAFARIAAAPPPRVAMLPASGYFVARTSWSPGADYLCFDCGEQAGGLRRDDVPSAAHGHADALSVVLHLGGRPVLVDPGFYCYNGDPEWEVAFRRTGKHNTILVDGRDQAEHRGKMNWIRTYAAAFDGWSDAASVAWAQGGHDGYARVGLRHRRCVWLRAPGYLAICDELSGAGEHDVRVHFQFAPGTLSECDGGALFDGRFELAWTADAVGEPSTRCGGPGPADGWISLSLGVREPAPAYSVGFRFAPPRLRILTVVADRTRGGDVSGARVRRLAGLALAVATPDGEDRLMPRTTDGPASEPLLVIESAAGASPEEGVRSTPAVHSAMEVTR